jgi:hypothetical protein
MMVTIVHAIVTTSVVIKETYSAIRKKKDISFVVVCVIASSFQSGFGWSL